MARRAFANPEATARYVEDASPDPEEGSRRAWPIQAATLLKRPDHLVHDYAGVGSLAWNDRIGRGIVNGRRP